jgi:hypothetical protein
VGSQYAEDEYYKYTFVIDPQAPSVEGRGLCYGFLNGILSYIAPIPTSFNNRNKLPIAVDSTYADVYIKSIKYYDEALPFDTCVDGFIVDQPSSAEIESLYNFNSVLSVDGKDENYVSPQKLREKGHGVIIISPAENQTSPKRLQELNEAKEHLIKSFKDLKYMKHCLIHHNGHIIVFCDDKRISLLYFPKLTSKHHKIISKNIDSDVISDISYSETTRQIAVSSKNGKSIYFYVISSESTKNKLIKHQNAIINTTRKYEIKNISIRKDGKYVITSGTDQDTEIQIYNTKTLKLVDKMETGGINNLEMKMNPNDNDIMISTFLNDISIIHFDKSEKFNNESKAYEVVEKITRYKSVPSKKDKILGFEFSNDDMFFVVACDKLIKIYQHYGNVSESKSFIEFNTTTTTGVVSL